MTTLNNNPKYLVIAFSLILSPVIFSKGGAECFSSESLSSHADGSERTEEARAWKRVKRQDAGLDDESKKTAPSSSLVCDFGAGEALELCSWTIPLDAHPNLRWKTGQGSTAYWLGGPLADKTTPDDNTGEGLSCRSAN